MKCALSVSLQVSFEQFKEGFISILTEAEDEPPSSESVTSDVPGASSEAGESQEAPGSKKGMHKH